MLTVAFANFVCWSFALKIFDCMVSKIDWNSDCEKHKIWSKIEMKKKIVAFWKFTPRQIFQGVSDRATKNFTSSFFLSFKLSCVVLAPQLRQSPRIFHTMEKNLNVNVWWPWCIFLVGVVWGCVVGCWASQRLQISTKSERFQNRKISFGWSGKLPEI